MSSVYDLINTIRKDVKKNYNNERKLLFYNKLKKQYEETKDEKIKAKADAVKKEIVFNNLFLVIYMVGNQSFPAEMDELELISIGTIALINSVDKYRLHEDVKFSSYAAKSVVKEVYKSINRWYGENSENYGYPITEFMHRATEKYDEDIFAEEIVDEILNQMLREEKIRPGTLPELRSRLLSHYMEPEDIDEEVSTELDYDRMDKILFIEKHKEEILSVLLPSERLVIEYTFGFIDGMPHEQKELAEIQGISHQAVNQKYTRAMEKMKKVVERYK